MKSVARNHKIVLMLSALWLGAPATADPLDDIVLTAQNIVDAGTTWQMLDGPYTVEHHFAGAGADGQLYEFLWTPLSDWQLANVSAISGIPGQITGPTKSWQTPDGLYTVEHLAGAGTDGQLYVFWRHRATGSDWQVVNVSAIAGISDRTISGEREIISWQTLDGPYNVEHLAAGTSDGDLLVFWWSPRADWQVINVSEITGHKIARLVSGPQDYQSERLTAIGPDGQTYVFSWTPASDWQVAKVPPPGSGPQPPKPPMPSPTPAGMLLGAYYFDAPGYQPFDLTVDFRGTLLSASGSGDGQTTFAVTQSARIVPGPQRSVSFTANGLRRGKWVVTAIPRAVGGHNDM